MRPVETVAFPDADLLVDAYENPHRRARYRALVVEAILDAEKRLVLNAFYNRLNLLAKAIFQVLYSDLFREYSVDIEPCTWTVETLGSRLEFPLRTETLWLDWALSQGVDTVTFEPNQECVAYFEGLLEFNGLQGDIISAAVGAKTTTATLSFSRTESWMGSISMGKEEASATPDVQSVTVSVVTLDQVVRDRGLSPGW
jgi:FkbM family methyltransferase